MSDLTAQFERVISSVSSLATQVSSLHQVVASNSKDGKTVAHEGNNSVSVALAPSSSSPAFDYTAFAKATLSSATPEVDSLLSLPSASSLDRNSQFVSKQAASQAAALGLLDWLTVHGSIESSLKDKRETGVISPAHAVFNELVPFAKALDHLIV